MNEEEYNRDSTDPVMGKTTNVGHEELTKEEVKRTSTTRDIINLVLYIGVVIITAILLNHFVIQKVEVSGHSMDTTLKEEQQLILEKVTYYFNEPERYDIVVFNPPNFDSDSLYIKRIIGLPGETVQIIDGKVYINGTELLESYAKEEILDPGIATDPVTVGENEYFVMGDNRNASSDSREFGVISRDSIHGRAVLRVWPLSDFGLLTDK